ncbi:glycoside hydrolase family 12 protein [Jaapia argillacea MUCL 33604]|uniref:Glycoside hydrolase family 12 protein n=1 Tax=Jaapia argillacea MUCL 33604 TaxID=933084 RepID=A0A067PDC7_9AGAM|nr:glycoside hydrolase family 12 protein [Jaapia argillacea MUCL 33604]
MFSYLKGLLLALAAVQFVGASTLLTGQYTCVTSGNYELCNNQWGIANGVGSQNATLISTSGNSISWLTTYTWANNPNDVKTYTNVLSNTAKGVQLSAITSAETTYDWYYNTQSSGLRADVSYDIWFGTAESGTAASSSSSYEIMVWLSGLGGIQPVGSSIVTGISLAGYTWDLWKATTETWETYSFIPHTTGTSITSFSADLNVFFKYLTANEGISTAQYVQAIQSGTEAFTGTAEITISTFSVTLSG